MIPDITNIRRLLEEALTLGIRVGTDGTDLIMHVPKQVPTETREWFYRQIYEFKAEVIEVIRRETAARSGVM